MEVVVEVEMVVVVGKMELGLGEEGEEGGGGGATAAAAATIFSSSSIICGKEETGDAVEGMGRAEAQHHEEEE